MTESADPLDPFPEREHDVAIEIAQNGSAVTIVVEDNPDAWLTADQLVEVRR